MYILTNESFGSRQPSEIEHHKDQVIVYDGIYSQQVEREGELVTEWFAATGTHYTIEEYAVEMDLVEDRAVTTAYENTIELIEELRPEV